LWTAGKLLSALISRAADEARRLRHNWLGPCHYLLAVLAEPSSAAEAMAELGVTHDRFAQGLVATDTVGGRRIRYVKAKGTTANPAAHAVNGWAKGFGAASGRRQPSPEDWLLAVVYSDNGVVGSVLDGLGVSSGAIADALRCRGLKVPDSEPGELRPWRGHRTVEVATSEWRAVADALREKHAPGSEWRWGFNSKRDRPGKVQFSAEEGIDLDAIVADALARKS
jgi:ATP-dependent Clp protease ATP-binding subunit ClpA